MPSRRCAASPGKGAILVVGFPAGIPKLPLNLTLLKSCDVCGVFWGAFAARDPKANAAHVEQLFRWWDEGKIAPRISATYPLERAGEAIAALRDAPGDRQAGGDALNLAEAGAPAAPARLSVLGRRPRIVFVTAPDLPHRRKCPGAAERQGAAHAAFADAGRCSRALLIRRPALVELLAAALAVRRGDRSRSRRLAVASIARQRCARLARGHDCGRRRSSCSGSRWWRSRGVAVAPRRALRRDLHRPISHRANGQGRMMTFDDRERAFEAKFAHDEEMQFRIIARRNRLLGAMGGAADGPVRGGGRRLCQGRDPRRLRGSRRGGRDPQGARRPDRRRGR